MAARRKLTDATKVKEVIDKFIVNPKPTLAGLLIDLDIKHLTTLHKYMSEDTEIGDLLCRAYIHIVYSHEVRMFDNKATPSIYYLKTLRKLGFDFTDRANEVDTPPTTNNITFNVVDKK